MEINRKEFVFSGESQTLSIISMDAMTIDKFENKAAKNIWLRYIPRSKEKLLDSMLHRKGK